MGRLTISTRGMIVAVAVVGFDAAAMTRAVQQGRAAQSVNEYAIGFGLVLLILNLIVLGLYLYYAKRADSSRGSRLNSTPPPLVIFGLYVAVLAIAILSVLFLTSGRF
jgi:cytochrome b561